eukprot:2451506-Pleurochrysis_carterae.AAC.2
MGPGESESGASFRSYSTMTMPTKLVHSSGGAEFSNTSKCESPKLYLGKAEKLCVYLRMSKRG